MNELEVEMKKKKQHVFEAATRFDDLHENNKMMIVRRKIVKEIRLKTHSENVCTVRNERRERERAECVSDVYFNVNAV